MPYKLSATLSAHSSDVRALCSPTDNLILSASRDTTAISWQRSSSQTQFAPAHVLHPGSRFVNAVAYIPSTLDAPKGYAVTGGQDTVINVFSMDNPKEDPDIRLIGHTDNVCTLHVTPGGTIVSGSWDRTAKVWKNFSMAYELQGHQQSVWAVLGLDDEDQVLTGSADKTIKLWRRGKLLQTYRGHHDAVRGLVSVPDIGFASCSNDSEIRVWTLGGDLIHTLSGHTSFVYSLSVLPSGDIVSAGEDRSVRVWKDGECAQVITHPALSVWAVSTMPNGDIVTGCSDGEVRVFSASEDRWVSEDQLRNYEGAVAKQVLSSQEVGSVKKSDLPGVDALTVPGKKSGEVKMINNNGVVEAHQWDGMSNKWQKVGDVVDAVGQGRKQLYQGREYDYVFDIDIQDGVPPLKLPYNVTENPFSAAQRFLESNDLPLSYIDEVVRFIESNTAGVSLGANDEYVDPFTGNSRYRGSALSSSVPVSENVDPFTGASRYRAATQTTTPRMQSSPPMDPFTGASRLSGSSQVSQSVLTLQVLPVTSMLNFKQVNVHAMKGKIFQLNEGLISEEAPSNSSMAMTADEIERVNEIFLHLTQATASPPQRTSIQLASRHIEALVQVLKRWPPPQLFPVIDLFRVLFAFSPGVINSSGLKGQVIEALFKAVEWASPWASPMSKTRETNVLLLLRTLANIFEEGSVLGDPLIEQILASLMQMPYEILTKNQRVSLATIVFNLSCQTIKVPLGDPLRSQHISLILTILKMETAESEALYRALVAAGNIMHASKLNNDKLDVERIGEIAQAIRVLPSTFPEERVRKVATEISAQL